MNNTHGFFSATASIHSSPFLWMSQNSPIEEIVRQGRVDLLEYKTPEEIADYRDPRGHTLLHIALQKDQQEMTLKLMKICPNLLVVSNRDNKYPLDQQNDYSFEFIEKLIRLYDADSAASPLAYSRQLATLCYLKSDVLALQFAEKHSNQLQSVDPRQLASEPDHCHPLKICISLQKTVLGRKILDHYAAKEIRAVWALVAGAKMLLEDSDFNNISKDIPIWLNEHSNQFKHAHLFEDASKLFPLGLEVTNARLFPLLAQDTGWDQSVRLWDRNSTGVCIGSCSFYCWAFLSGDAHTHALLDSIPYDRQKLLKEILEIEMPIYGVSEEGVHQFATLYYEIAKEDPTFLTNERFFELLGPFMSVKKNEERSLLPLIEPILQLQPTHSAQFFKNLDLSFVLLRLPTRNDFEWFLKQGLPYPSQKKALDHFLEEDDFTEIFEKGDDQFISWWMEHFVQRVLVDDDRFCHQREEFLERQPCFKNTWTILKRDNRFTPSESVSYIYNASYHIEHSSQDSVLRIFRLLEGKKILIQRGYYTFERLLEEIESDETFVKISTTLAQFLLDVSLSPEEIAQMLIKFTETGYRLPPELIHIDLVKLLMSIQEKADECHEQDLKNLLKHGVKNCLFNYTENILPQIDLIKTIRAEKETQLADFRKQQELKSIRKKNLCLESKSDWEAYQDCLRKINEVEAQINLYTQKLGSVKNAEADLETSFEKHPLTKKRVIYQSSAHEQPERSKMLAEIKQLNNMRANLEREKLPLLRQLESLNRGHVPDILTLEAELQQLDQKCSNVSALSKQKIDKLLEEACVIYGLIKDDAVTLEGFKTLLVHHDSLVDRYKKLEHIGC